jgi:hypothetical protein
VRTGPGSESSSVRLLVDGFTNYPTAAVSYGHTFGSLFVEFRAIKLIVLPTALLLPPLVFILFLPFILVQAGTGFKSSNLLL